MYIMRPGVKVTWKVRGAINHGFKVKPCFETVVKLHIE